MFALELLVILLWFAKLVQRPEGLTSLELLRAAAPRQDFVLVELP